MASPASTTEAQELRRLIPLNTLSEERFEQLCSEIKVEEGPKGTVLFRQGDPTGEFVYVLSGTISLQAGGVEMDSVSGSSETGRFALAHQNPRKVTAVAKDRIRYLRVSPDLINQRDEGPAQPPAYTVSHNPDEADGDWISALLRSPVFRRLPPSNLQALLRSVEEIEVQAGDVICRQDERGDYFYIIKQGQCVLTRKPSPLAKEIKLANLKDFDAFGEDALISDQPRTVTVTMSTDGVLLRLDKANFLRLVGNPVISRVEPQEAIDLVKQGGAWLDIRVQDVHQLGHPRGALNIPFFSLRMMLATLDRHRKYVLACEDGKLSEAGAYLLLRHGFDAYALKGGLAALPESELSTGPQPPSATAAPAAPAEIPEPDDVELIELEDWEPPAPERNAPAAMPEKTPQNAEELRLARERLAHAEGELKRLEGERERLIREKDLALAELERSRQATKRLEASLQPLRQELAELKAKHAIVLSGKEAAEQEAEALQKQTAELQSMLEEFVAEGGEYTPAEEVEALRSELEMVREHAGAELAALQAKMGGIEADNAKLRAETQTLKTQISIRDVALEVAKREDGTADRRSLPARLALPILAGLLVAALVLGGLLGLGAGRDLLRGWLDSGAPAAAPPAEAPPPPVSAPSNPSP
jgi:CRP-like cAMP-binding protein